MTSISVDNGAYQGTFLGTAAGTTTLQRQPTFLSHITVTNRVASGAITLYDSIGTSSSVIGTISMGTQPGYDGGAPYVFKFNTKTALTVVNSANVGCFVAWLP